MISGTVAVVSRKRQLFAVRCADGRFTLVRFSGESFAILGDALDGPLKTLGKHSIKFADGSSVSVEIVSFNCSVQFIHDRMTEG